MPIVLPSLKHPALTEPTYIKPPVWKPVLAWVGLVFGGLVAVVAIATIGDGIRESMAMTLFGLAMAVPGGWWVFCERKDRTHAEEDFLLDRQAESAQQTMAGYVSPGALSPLTWDTPLTPVARRWPVMGSAAVVLLGVALALMPTPDPEPAATTSPTTATSALTSSARLTASIASTVTTAQTPAESTGSTVQTGSAAAEATPVESESKSESVEPEAVASDPGQARRYATAPQPTSAPEQSDTSAPTPPQVSYADCSEARAAGAAPLFRGQPGYTADLDRDNDGIACD